MRAIPVNGTAEELNEWFVLSMLEDLNYLDLGHEDIAAGVAEGKLIGYREGKLVIHYWDEPIKLHYA